MVPRFGKHAVRLAVGLTALGLAACGGDNADRPAGSRATVDSTVAAVTARGDVPVEFRLRDADSTPVTVELRYSLDDGRSWQTGTSRESLADLASSPDGVSHRVHWASLDDLGFRIDERVRVEVRVAGAEDPDAGGLRVAYAGGGAGAATSPDNLPAAADRVEAWLIHLGPLEAGHLDLMRRHDLVVLDPNQPGVTRADIAAIQLGVDPLDPRDDVIVLARVMVGEDPRTVGLGDLAMQSDPRFVGDGSGPRVDPRGPGAAGGPLQGIDPLGAPSGAGGFAAFYLDDNSRDNGGVGDGLPDRNPQTGACFVNPGAPTWFDVLDAMRSDGLDATVGFAQALQDEASGGLGFDGIYLDGVDHCAPNDWTWSGSPVQTEFEWTAGGYASLLARLRQTWPDALVMQNRGLFFFNPALPHYALRPGPDLDFVLFSSYRLDASLAQAFDPYWFGDNKHNFMPKLQAEANRRDGFQVLSLGYAAGPGISPDTLTGASQTGLAELLTDIDEAQRIAGFRHYLTDPGNLLVNDFVATHATNQDGEAPVWSSTWNRLADQWPNPPGRPDARVGLQAVEPGTQSVTVHWDVALDHNPVHYVLYYQDEPLNFRGSVDGDGDALAHATRVVLDPQPGTDYARGPALDRYAYRAEVPGLQSNRSYWFLLRAVDSLGNEDSNRNVLRITVPTDRSKITIDGNFSDWNQIPVLARDRNDVARAQGPDWREVRVTHDDERLYVFASSYDRFDLQSNRPLAQQGFRILIDADDDPHTGYVDGLTGAELAVVGSFLVRQVRGVGDSGALQMLQVSGRKNLREAEIAIPLAQLDLAAGRQARRIRLLFHNRLDGDRAPDTGYLSVELAR